MEIPWGGGFQKPNFWNESMTLKWNFRRGLGEEGGQTKKSSVGGVWIFSGTTHNTIMNYVQCM